MHFGERGRSGGVLIAERLMSVLDSGGLETAALIRGAEGFGLRHGMRSSERLTLSEDLPMVAIALGPSEVVGPVAEQARTLFKRGLVTVETTTRNDTGGSSGSNPGSHPAGDAEGDCRLTVWTRRGARIEGRPAHAWVLNRLKQNGAQAGIALLGVDGISGGARQRAGFFSPNRDVPLMVVGVASREAAAATGNAVSLHLPEVLLETVDLIPPGRLADGELSNSDFWRLTLFSGGSGPEPGVRHQGDFIRMLRRQGAPGATGYLGLCGFVGEEEPRGDSLRHLRRRVPALTEIVDTAENCERWLRELEGSGAGAGLTTLSPVRPLSRPGGPA